MDLEQARAVLLDHARRPRNVRLPDDAHPDRAVYRTGECRNPLCGDHVRVSVRVADARISDCWLQVEGCTICTASASLMGDLVKTRTVVDVDELRTDFATAIRQSAGHLWPTALNDLSALQHLRVNPARIPCALIGWLALKDALAIDRLSANYPTR
jgi:nitrogen fixation protein NifU and related proteins